MRQPENCRVAAKIGQGAGLYECLMSCAGKGEFPACGICRFLAWLDAGETLEDYQRPPADPLFNAAQNVMAAIRRDLTI